MAVLIRDKFSAWEAECRAGFEKLKANETEINRIAAKAYGMSDEVEVIPDDGRISVRRADLSRELRSLLSYALGCMLGRYSLDEEGLVFAGGDWDISRYHRFIPAQSGLIFIDENDIIRRLNDFLTAAYGSETLGENLRYIEESLGVSCLKYYRDRFFRDHCRTYRHRPIYWLISSGRRGAVRALTYIHRFGSAELEQLLSETDRRISSEVRSGHFDELNGFRVRLEDLISSGVKIVPDDGVSVNFSRFSSILARIPG